MHAGALGPGADLPASGLDDARGDAQVPGAETRAPRVAGDALDSAGEIASIRSAVAALALDAVEARGGLNDAIARCAALLARLHHRQPHQPALRAAGIAFEVVRLGAADPERRERLAAVKRWHEQDWQALDRKLCSSIIEGLSVFLSVFDLPDVARVFCPPAPPAAPPPPDEAPAESAVDVVRPLPPLDEVIDSGKVLSLNMPAGTNPALSRAVGVLLKQAWLQTLLRRPAAMQRDPERVFRPAVVLCEYQTFAGRRGRPGRRREGVRSDAAVAPDPHRRHAVDLVAPPCSTTARPSSCRTRASARKTRGAATSSPIFSRETVRTGAPATPGSCRWS